MRTLATRAATAALLGLLPACGRETPTALPEEGALASSVAQATTIVSPGASIQAAIDAAQPGAVIHLRPGVYLESVTIAKRNLTLMGLNGPGGERAVLVNPGGAMHGINVVPGGDGVTIANLATRGFDRNGVFLRGIDGFTVRHVVAEDNGAYGIYPVLSTNGVVRHSTASGHADAGLYIGQSTNVRMEHNTAYGNVIGLEISNSTDVIARHNHTYDNSVGILAILLPASPFRQFLEASDVEISHNRVHDNNHPNFAPPGDFASFVPSGSGILVVGFDDSVVEHNEVTGNNWVGIGVGSTTTLGALAGISIVGIEPDPDRVVVRHNRVLDNGQDPPELAIPLPGVDLLWDFTGTANCWRQNVFQTSFPAPLPACG